ncbi:ankyrin repeat-containing protein 04_02 [Orientia tsutsugamushi str. Ikeda]|uniref:Ankyrin repeat-containing protein 04_01 n=1 Tax=Orientia tsutsugamushi (strain Ikeda) TaxID=334380 RepID=B3CS75_ORITI|nr:ankyrin repeat domain-containing protein [Orientia tsutsugamushi]BAG39668.1 ankyrin repeat-containing protein 04_01 [Orientia tsutsugamushi str. Ikeda]BAG41374.1 ankyrin repeat-containing protein 04_02 [Orientia tsutsugamushi str. Ikeda]
MNNGNLLHDLYHAVRYDNIDDVKRILAQDMSLINSIHDAVYHEGGFSLAVNASALHTAVLYKRINIAIFLLNSEVNVNVQDKYGATPLHYAISRYDANMVMLLLNNGANVNVPCTDGITALHSVVTSTYYNTDRIELLVSKEGDIDVQKNNGRTVLHDAAEYGQKDIVEWLLSRNAKALLRDNSGKIPAHFAAQYGYKDVMKLLLDKDCNIINLQDNGGQTVLHLAVLRHSTLLNREPNEEYIRYEERWLSEDERLDALSRSAELIKMIYDYGGINFSLKNANGYTVLDLALAIEHDQHKIAEHLQEKRLLWMKEQRYVVNESLIIIAKNKEQILKPDSEKNDADKFLEKWLELDIGITKQIVEALQDDDLGTFQQLYEEYKVALKGENTNS